MQDQQQDSYLERGFNAFFNRVPQKSDTNPYDYRGFYDWEDYAVSGIPQVDAQDAATMFQSISANTITEGVLQSANGRLQIDLNQGSLSYNDGAVDLLRLGGQDNNLTINNSSNTSILSS